VSATSADRGDVMEPLRQELVRRRARRYRRRWIRRWKRRRLLLRLMAIEYDLADPRYEDLRQLQRDEAERIEGRLAKNAERLFR
jgi:type II secretory pathway component PulL